MNILNFEEHLPQTLEAVRKWSAPVISTMGGQGKNVIIQTPKGIRSTQDGITVVRELNPPDPIGKIVVSMLQDASNKVVQEVGDGTTLTVLLTARLLEGISSLKLPFNQVSHHIDQVVEQVLERMKVWSVKVVDKKGVIDLARLQQIASIACHGDENLGYMVAQLAHKVGPNGVMFLNNSPSAKTYTEYQDGYVLDGGLMSPHFINNRDGSCTLSNPEFVLINEKVDSENDVYEILGYYQKNSDRPLVFLVGNMDGGALATIIANLPNGNPQGLKRPMTVIQVPQAQRLELFEDLKALTGTPHIYSRLFGRSMRDFGSDFDVREFGSAVKIVATHKQTVIIPTQRPKEYIEGLIEQEEKENDPELKNLLHERVIKLSAGIGTIFCGGDSDYERQWVFDMADDAQRACMAAMKEGIVAGAGKALLMAAEEVNGLMTKSQQMNPVSFVVLSTLKSPMETIYSNAEREFDIDAETSDKTVIDVATGNRVDPFKAGIVDPYLVPATALRMAVSVVKQVMKTSYYLTN